MGPGRLSARVVAAAAFAWSLSIGSPSLAQPAVTLRWTAPAGCPSRAAVEAEVSRLLAGTTSDAGAVHAEARVTREGDGFRLRLEIARQDARSVRELDGRTCLAVARAAALMVALTVNPDAARSAAPAATPLPEPAPSAPPTSTPPTPASPAAPSSGPSGAAPPSPAAALPAPEAAAVPAPPGRDRRPAASGRADAPDRGPSGSPAPAASGRSEPLVWLFFAGGLGDVGTLGAPTAAIEAGAAILPGPFRIDASASLWPARRVLTDEDAGIGADVGLLAGGGTACLAPPFLARRTGGHAEFDLPCAGVEIGRMHATSFGVTADDTGSGVWVAGRFGVGAALTIASWLSVRLRVEAVTPFARPRFVVGGVGTVHEPTVAARTGLALELGPREKGPR